MQNFTSAIALFIYYVWYGSYFYMYYMDSRIVKGRALLTAIPQGRDQQDNVKAVLEEYKKRLRYFTYVVVVVSVYFILPLPYTITIALICCCLMTIVLMCLGSFSMKRMREIKHWEHWPIKDRGYHIDTKLEDRTGRTMLKPYFFLLPVGINMGVIIYKISTQALQDVLGISAMFFVFIAVFGYLFIRWMPNRTFCGNHEINQAVNENYKYYFSLFLLCLCVTDSLTVLFLLYAGNASSSTIFSLLVLMMIIYVLMAYTIFFLFRKLYKIKSQFLNDTEEYTYDEDEFWSYGIFGARYRNSYDPAFFKENNSGGTNINLNMSRTSIKVLCIAFWSVFIIFMSYLFLYPYFLDIRHELSEITMDSTTVYIESPFYRKSIDIETIEDIRLIDALPKGIRTAGTSTGSYDTGNYSFDTIGKCKLYIASRHKLYLIADTTSGVIIFNDDEGEKTEKLYHQLKSRMEEIK